MKIHKNITELIGNTPLLELVNFNRKNQLGAKVIAKLEYFNPAGSVKDRIAFAMLSKAKEQGLIDESTVIIEPTSGNTGIGLAFISATWGNRIILTMPETMSIERRKLLQCYGAELVLTDGKYGMKGAIAKAIELAGSISNSFIPSQFENLANPEIHRRTTGREIWKDTGGKIDIFVGGVGTGGTISGVGKYLKSKNSNIKIIAVEPQDSPVLSKGIAGSHGIQGIGAGFIPDTLNTGIYDEIITVPTAKAIETSRELAKSEQQKHQTFIEQRQEIEQILLYIFGENVEANKLFRMTGLNLDQLDKAKNDIEKDVQFLFENDPSAKSVNEIRSYTSQFAIAVYRVSHIIADIELARRMTEYAKSVSGVDIHPQAKIGLPFAIDHGVNVVIGETAIIGNNVILYHGVTLGAKTLKARNQTKTKRHPTLGNNVKVYSNTTIIGNVNVPDGTIIGANMFLKNQRDVDEWVKIKKS